MHDARFASRLRRAATLLALLAIAALLTPRAAVQAARPRFNYAETLQKAIYFYDTQRSGALPANNRVEWRGDSGLGDGAEVGHDLTGGWYDAGDNVKFGFPMASTTTLLAWGADEYHAAYAQSGQLPFMLANLRWATDYFLKAHTAPDELYAQVGSGATDHDWWGAAEVMPTPRPAFKIDATCPGSDLAAETAAALASSAIVFQPTDADYARTLIAHARQLYRFADEFRGTYSDCVPDAKEFYASSGYDDELVWGALWLYRATGERAYLDKAELLYANMEHDSDWTQNWDDKIYGCYVLLAELTDNPTYRADAEQWLDYWTVGSDDGQVMHTPGGLAWLDQWGSLSYAANTAFLALVYSDHAPNARHSADYHAFAVRQIGYILGDNPRGSSYMIGFGNNPPTHPHHATAHGSWANDLATPAATRHTIYGALVGGPDARDGYADEREDYVRNEVADDYNAGLVGALARLTAEYGGAPLAAFPPPEPRDAEFFAETRVQGSGANFVEIEAWLNNHSAWPARDRDGLAFRYFVTLDGDLSPRAIAVALVGGACGAASQLQPYQANVYFVLVDCSGVRLAPVGPAEARTSARIRLDGPRGWHPSGDPAFQALRAAGDAPVKDEQVVIYDHGAQVGGVAP